MTWKMGLATRSPWKLGDRSSEEWLGERLNRVVTVANDADLAAVGEAYFGAASFLP